MERPWTDVHHTRKAPSWSADPFHGRRLVLERGPWKSHQVAEQLSASGTQLHTLAETRQASEGFPTLNML